MTANCLHGLISTHLLGKPGLMRDSLCTLLHAIPCVRIDRVDGLLQADLDRPDDWASRCLIIDCSNSEPEFAILALLDRVRKKYPQIRCLVISTSKNHIETYLSAGADGALVSGFTISEMEQALHALVAER
jgi:DNA-binding NarL/FixJ family response regulator